MTNQSCNLTVRDNLPRLHIDAEIWPECWIPSTQRPPGGHMAETVVGEAGESIQPFASDTIHG